MSALSIVASAFPPPQKTPVQVGLLTVKGTDAFAAVCRRSRVDFERSGPAVHVEDNEAGIPRGGPASAFERCVEWARGNQDLA